MARSRPRGFFRNGNQCSQCAPAPPHALSPEKKELWSKLFNIFLELFSIPVLVSYGMHSSHTSKYDYVYMLNREENLHTDLKKQKKSKTIPLYRNCISLHIFTAVKSILFLKTCIQMYIYFPDFYPTTRGQQMPPQFAVALAVSGVYSRFIWGEAFLC